MSDLFQIIDSLYAELNGLRPVKPEYQKKFDEKIRLEFNYNSNHIEGNTLTYGETELLLLYDKTTGNHEWREYEEMKSHDLVFELIKQLSKDKERPLNEAIIKELHRKLLVKPFYKDAITPDGEPTKRLIEIGDYKKYPNSVRLSNGNIFHYTSPTETPIEMGELIQWYRDEENQIHPVTLAAMLHYKFVRIHPFDDGNGRMSRLLMNYVLLKNNFPPVIIQSSDKKNYLFALNQADAGDIESFIRYICQELIKSLELYIAAAKGDNIEEKDDWKKKVALLKKNPNDSIITIKTESAITSLLQQSIIPLLRAIIRELSCFDDLFVDKRIRLGKSNLKKVKDIREIELLIKADPSYFYNRFFFSYQLIGYKINGIGTFSCSIELTWDFNDYSYQFKIDTPEPQENTIRFYHQYFSSDEINSIVNKLGTILYEQIQSQISSNQNSRQ